MKRTLLVFSILIIFAVGSYSQNEFRRTGNYWKEIENIWGDNEVIKREVKLAYVIGLYEGYVFGVTNKEQEYNLPGHEMGYVCCDSLDQFYNDDRNLNIPIVHALAIIDMELQGEKKVAIEKNLRELREKFGKVKREEIAFKEKL